MRIHKREPMAHRVGVRLTERQWARLQELAGENDTSPSVVVRSLLIEALRVTDAVEGA